MSDCETKADLKNATDVDISSNLSKFKIKRDKLDADKLVPRGGSRAAATSKMKRFDLSKLSNVVRIDDVKKDVYNAKITNIEDKVSNFTKLATNTTLNTKINERNI